MYQCWSILPAGCAAGMWPSRVPDAPAHIAAAARLPARYFSIAPPILSSSAFSVYGFWMNPATPKPPNRRMASRSL